MKQLKNLRLKNVKWIVISLASFGCALTVATHQQQDRSMSSLLATSLHLSSPLLRTDISAQIGNSIKRGEFIDEIEFPQKLGDLHTDKLKVTYTLDAELQKMSEGLLKLYRPDYGVIVAVDPSSGRILSMSSFQKDAASEPENLALRATFPAASVFKIITASAAVDKYHLSPEATISYNGANHTLYKKNVFDTSFNRYTRAITLREAFGKSINTVFGKVGLQLEPQDLEEYASRFFFNKVIPSDFPVESGYTLLPKEKGFEIAEIASGYNRITRMSPVQGAMIASAIANDGKIPAPFLVESLKNAAGETIYTAQPEILSIAMTPESAQKVRELMEETIFRGTSRKSFRTLIRDRRYSDLEMGGKTGSLYGDNPKGKCDWFVGYARKDDRKIAVAAITVNKERWTVKSNFLAQTLFRQYFAQTLASTSTPPRSLAGSARINRGDEDNVDLEVKKLKGRAYKKRLRTIRVRHAARKAHHRRQMARNN